MTRLFYYISNKMNMTFSLALTNASIYVCNPNAREILAFSIRSKPHFKSV